MANTTSPVAAGDYDALFGEVKQYWGWMLASGIFFIILGVVGLGMTFALTVFSILFFGVILIIGGAGQLVEAFRCKGWKGILWHVLIGLLYIVAGIFIIVRPIEGAATLTLFIAVILIIVGIFRIIMALQMRHFGSWFWPFLSGVISILLGTMIYSQWPVSGLWVIGLFVAIEMIMHGWAYVCVAMAAKGYEKEGSLAA
jgi:uncharacterized membrane protein HdeD (DUF308 family)